MGQRDTDRDYRLVQECISGSEAAWRRLYGDYAGLMRNVVRRKAALTDSDCQDVVQSAFVVLTSALKTYDPRSSLSHFVCMITERVLIDELRRSSAAKRAGQTSSVDHHDGDDEGAVMVRTEGDSQEESMEKAETSARLHDALAQLDEKCRELITLRYYSELSYAEISERLGSTENTLTVQTRRCLDKLKTKFSADT
jgi:RNA polymerase sigma-70 factor (ECF subfamily)